MGARRREATGGMYVRNLHQRFGFRVSGFGCRASDFEFKGEDIGLWDTHCLVRRVARRGMAGFIAANYHLIAFGATKFTNYYQCDATV